MSHVEPIRVGRIEVRTICEGWGKLALADELPGRAVDWNGERERRPWAFDGDGSWPWHVHGFVLTMPSGERVAVDAGVGDFPPYVPWVESSPGAWREVRAAEDIRHVIVTHLHADHAGGTVVGGEPAFPNATVHVHEADWSAFAGSTDEDYVARHAMSVLLELGALSVTDHDHEIVPGVHVRHTPGHTPGHRSVIVRDGEAVLALTGDLLHMPTQIAHPEWWSSHDEDPQLAAAARRMLLWRAAHDGWRVGVPHFARPFGRVGPHGWLE